jgi:hypothetical protein
LLYGTFSILTPPFVIYHKLWCPFFSTYPNFNALIMQ